jgi:transketolase
MPQVTHPRPTGQTAIGAPDLDALCVNTIRTLAIDAIQQATSGHPGAPMAMASVAYTLIGYERRRR